MRAFKSWIMDEQAKAEILSTWSELSPAEAYEAFDAGGVGHDAVAAVLGDGVAAGYSDWVYGNLK